VLELDRLDHVEQRHPAVRLLRAAAGVAERVAHLVALVDDDEEDALLARGAPLGPATLRAAHDGSGPPERDARGQPAATAATIAAEA
jgi:hypothetical protein